MGDILTSSEEVERYIYDSIKNGYSYNYIPIESFELLQPEEYYSDKNPAVSSIVFSEPEVFTNTKSVRCTYYLTQTSFLGEERAAEYALANETDAYLTDSEKELKDKVIELAEQLKVMAGDSNTSGQGILDEYETVKSIHDYLVTNIVYTYSSGIGNGTDAKADQKLRSALFQHQCVCAGYAKSFYFLCKAAGLDVVYVTGTATNGSGSSESHAWNKVKIGDNWYAIDVTWDDPLVYDSDTGTSHDGGDQVVYNYFLITDSDMAYNHSWDDAGLPIADSTDLGIIYQQYASIRKFTNDSGALSHVRGELEAYCTDHSPRLSGFEFEMTVLSTDGSTLYNDLYALLVDYNSRYGCGGGTQRSDAGFYGDAFTLRLFH